MMMPGYHIGFQEGKTRGNYDDEQFEISERYIMKEGKTGVMGTAGRIL
jgi:hypothetical protein